MKIDHRRKVHKKHTTNNMLVGTQNYCAAANLANNNLKSGTDFSIAAIMARGESSREPSERSISICHNIIIIITHCSYTQHIINLIKKYKKSQLMIMISKKYNIKNV